MRTEPKARILEVLSKFAETPSCPKIRAEPKARILEAFSNFAETRRRDNGSAIGEPEQSFPPKHLFRPAWRARTPMPQRAGKTARSAPK